MRHHLEWRADVDALEAYDWATDENFARGDGQPFDPAFYRAGEQVVPGVYKVDDDVFMEERDGVITWHGRRYRVPMPAGVQPPLFVTLEGLLTPPAGDVVLVVLKRPSLMDLFRRRPAVAQLAIVAQPLDD